MENKEIVKLLKPQFTTLSEKSTKDRPEKRRAIENVKKEVLKLSLSSSGDRADLLAQLYATLFICSESDIEYVREQALGLLEKLVEKCEKGTIQKSVIEGILGQAVKRMQEEKTEELRVGWIEMVVGLLGKLEGLNVTVTEGELFMDIIQISGKDPFYEVQKQCAKLLLLYSQTQSKSVDYACDRMVKFLFPILLHKHTAVRVSGIKAMEGVLKASPKGIHLLFEYDEKSGRQPLVPGLIYDTSALVRDNLFIAVSNLLCCWTPRYRYQYGGDLLAIILSGQFDELPSVQATCNSSLLKVSKSCVQDLVEAEIIENAPEDEEEAKLLGLKHFIHICYNESLLYLLGEITNFIKVRQDVGLESLQVFLELSAPDDLVKSIKKLVKYLFIAYANTSNEKVMNCLTILANKLPLPDIYAETLLPRLHHKYLMDEKNSFQGSVTVTIVLSFLDHLLSHASLSSLSQQHILKAIEAPYLSQYISKDLLQNYRQSILSKLNIQI